MKKILIIDDNKNLADTIKDFLIFSKYYEIEICNDGTTGLKKIYEWQPQLIILDIMLPELDGFEICEKITHLPKSKRPKIILLTTLKKILDTMNAKWLDSVNVDGFFSKPIDMIKLRNIIDDLLIVKRN
jgi:two-component system response regulator VicR